MTTPNGRPPNEERRDAIATVTAGTATTSGGTHTATVTPLRQTWRDWQRNDVPEPSLITRDELLSRLDAEGIQVSVDNLQNWQEDGVTPYGTRQWHGGATRLMYPSWMVGVVRMLRHLQGQGETLDKIAPRVRVQARDFQKTIDQVTTDGGRITAHETASIKIIPASASIAGIPHDIVERLQQWAQEHEETFGVRLARIDVSLVDEHERPLTFPIDALRS